MNKKDNKKGIAPATLVTLVVAAAVIIVVGIFLGKASGEAKTEGFNLGYGKIPEKKISIAGGSDSGSSEPTPAHSAVETEFVNAVRTAVASGEEICRVEFSAYPGFDDLKVILTKNGDDLELNAQRSFGAPVMLDKFENYAPCIANGINFFGWLWNGVTSAKEGSAISKQEVRIVRGGGSGLVFNPEDAEGKTKRDLKVERPLIYKYKKDAESKGYICLIHTFEDGSVWPFTNNDCNIDDNQERNAVDSDCILVRDSRDFLQEITRIPLC